MSDRSLKSITDYSRFLAELFNRPSIRYSTVSVWSVSPYTGVAEGEVFFTNDIRLRMREELDFDAVLIASYGYEIYQGEDRLYWYDDHPHPKDTRLASTHPHHKHIPPDIKHNRIAAQGITFNKPNLPFLIQEIEQYSP